MTVRTTLSKAEKDALFKLRMDKFRAGAATKAELTSKKLAADEKDMIFRSRMGAAGFPVSQPDSGGIMSRLKKPGWIPDLQGVRRGKAFFETNISEFRGAITGKLEQFKIPTVDLPSFKMPKLPEFKMPKIDLPDFSKITQEIDDILTAPLDLLKKPFEIAANIIKVIGVFVLLVSFYAIMKRRK